MSAVLLALTSLDAHSPRHLDKAATLAAATGMSLRLAYCGNGHHEVFDSPMARLAQRARHLRRQFGLVVDTVEEAMTSLDVLRFHANRCALLCLASAPTASTPTYTPWLTRALRLHSVPVLVMRTDTPARYRQVLVPVSLGAHSAHLVRWAGALATGARIEVLHISDPAEAPGRAFDDAEPMIEREKALRPIGVQVHPRLAELARGLKPHEGALHYAVASGPVRERILAHQHLHGHPLVVIGSGPRPCWAWPMWRLPLGMTLTRELQADTLIVPKPPPRRAWMPTRGWRSAT